ncbi:MAG: ABC transporter permease [Bacteroidota bacterium]
MPARPRSCDRLSASPDFLVPYTSRGWPNGVIEAFYCLVAGRDFAAARANLERSLRGNHGDGVAIAVWQGDPRFPRDFAADLRRTVSTVTLFFGALGLVALLVSSFGIFSVMTINTLKRTREIGLHRAIGATKSRVVGDFLFEALVLSVMGALLGLALAAVFNGPVIKAIQPILAGAAAMDAALAPAGLGLPAALCAVAVAALAGLLFGLFPAFSAARVAPVESLRER